MIKMDLLDTILNCKEEELESIINNAIVEADSKSTRIERLGFLEHYMANNCFKGFISLTTRIKYASMSIETYGMNTIDFFYDFAKFIRKYKINTKQSLIYSLELFINNYFGTKGKYTREQIFNDIAWKTTKTDSEYFDALENNKIGDLKGMGAALCTERSALAQQILSLFGFEVYYCMGCISNDTVEEAHCFNIIKRKNDYAIVDYSMPVASYNQSGNVIALYPFIGSLSSEEFESFKDDGVIKSFDNYGYLNKNQKHLTGTKRRYLIGSFQITDESFKIRR